MRLHTAINLVVQLVLGKKELNFADWKWRGIEYGLFINEVISFLIIALALFIFIVKFLGFIMKSKKPRWPLLPSPTKDQESFGDSRPSEGQSLNSSLPLTCGAVHDKFGPCRCFAPIAVRLALGDVDAPDLVPVREWLDRHIPPSMIRCAETLREIRRLKDEGVWHPDLIVVFQTWSDQFSGVDAHALFSWFALARVVCCHGPWCESDGRTRVQWPLAVRVPATLAAARLDLEREFLADPDFCPLPPPLTANRGDLFGAARGLAMQI